MNKAKYLNAIPSEKPLLEVMQERKAYYQEKLAKKLDEVYATRDIGQIGEFEKVVSGLCLKLVSEPKAESESSREISREEPRKAGKPDRRPRLTAYKYYQARDGGLTNTQIKEKFRIVNPYQLGGFGRQYAKRKKGEAAKAEGK